MERLVSHQQKGRGGGGPFANSHCGGHVPRPGGAQYRGSSVPVGFTIAADPADAGYVTFCRPPLPYGVRFDPAHCSPANPNGRPVTKRVTGVMDGEVHVRGDIPSALDGDLFGGLDIALVRRRCRPVFVDSS